MRHRAIQRFGPVLFALLGLIALVKRPTAEIRRRRPSYP